MSRVLKWPCVVFLPTNCKWRQWWDEMFPSKDWSQRYLGRTKIYLFTFLVADSSLGSTDSSRDTTSSAVLQPRTCSEALLHIILPWHQLKIKWLDGLQLGGEWLTKMTSMAWDFISGKYIKSLLNVRWTRCGWRPANKYSSSCQPGIINSILSS